MQSVLMYPAKKKQISLCLQVANFLKVLLTKRDRDYEVKIKILKRASYFWYLKRILKSNSNVVDLPEFLYFTGKAINTEAMRNAEWAVSEAAKKGKRHIDKCFKSFLKQI